MVLSGFAEESLEFGEGHFDRIEIGGVGRQQEELGAGRRSLGGTGRLMWNRSVFHYLCKAMQRLERMFLDNERLPNGWERGL
jgi:precorrin-6B methylase 2